jgi:hypothetical protein
LRGGASRALPGRVSLELRAVCFDALAPADVAAFWAGLLGWAPVDDGYGGAVLE